MQAQGQSDFFTTLLAAFGRGLVAGVCQGSEKAFPAGAPKAPPVSAEVERATPPPAPPPVQVPLVPKRAGFERVLYRQGRGTFEARIVRFDSANRMVELERLSDGKRLIRPMSKVYGGRP